MAVDLSDLPRQAVDGAPLATWFRFQRAIENTPTILLLVGRESAAKSAATLVLRTCMKQADWSGPVHGPSHGILFSGHHLELCIARGVRVKSFSHHVRFYPCS